MRIFRTLAIILMTAEAGLGPEMIRTFIVMRIRFFSTDRSRGRRRSGLGRMLQVKCMG